MRQLSLHERWALDEDLPPADLHVDEPPRWIADNLTGYAPDEEAQPTIDDVEPDLGGETAAMRALSEDPDIRAHVLAMAEAGADDPGEDFELLRAAGHDVTPGHDELHHYWTRGKGLSRWVASPEPWTTLLANLVEEVKDKPLEELKRWTSAWFMEVFGFSAGSDLNRVTHGHPPRGHRVGPG